MYESNKQFLYIINKLYLTCMKKVLFLIIFISGSLFAQDDGAKVSKPDYNKLLIGLSVSPGYSNVMFPNIGNSTDNIYKSQFGYGLGLNLNYNFSKRFGLITGVSWSTKGYEIDSGDRDPSITRRHFRAVIIPTYSINTKSSYYFIGIPLKSIFRMGKGKVRFVAGLGITTSILIKSTRKNIFEYQNGDRGESTSSEYSSNNKLGVSSAISFGIESSLKNKDLIRIEPNFKFDWFPNTLTRFWTAGINFSYYFGLKKNLN